ncbi:dimethylarginine dimethylaminohydrolase family protein [Granulosicoccus antarcticus]|uniref:N(G),N(G)-dimethylarginine dimethylaminohydrolase n=1 Tax=Granulosicoccus antarcticus IMCC3135 TaxID=1192854 RepID=A0A2Z2P4N3_9GAMM|nr:arginine deiminase family protein [Granulosicoccus antarcticus]ASJ74794.1 N(G),N(G)-dimethylarginine dimethylaminohydrolase [Granulosicoccus antarcticus IMCC3135]
MKAITRAISSAMQDCELTHMDRQALDLDRARQQHEAYNQALRDLAVDVIELAEQPTLADSVFVEDAALVFDEIAIITHPGAISRRPETSSIAEALEPLRPLAHIMEPAILDGGDVLTIGKEVYVGLSSRSNSEAVVQLQQHLESFGYTVHGLEMGKCLHLKTAVTALDDQTVLLNPDWVDVDLFKGYTIVKTHPDEPFGANVVRVGSSLLYGAGYPNTQAAIEALGHDVHVVDMSELAKAEGAVTCCSLMFN